MKFVAGIIAGILLAFAAPAIAQEDVENPPKWMSTPCASEDSPNCFWDAGEAGNGEGHSFYSIRFKHRDCVVYWDNKFAKKNNICYRR